MLILRNTAEIADWYLPIDNVVMWWWNKMKMRRNKNEIKKIIKKIKGRNLSSKASLLSVVVVVVVAVDACVSGWAERGLNKMGVKSGNNKTRTDKKTKDFLDKRHLDKSSSPCTLKTKEG